MAGQTQNARIGLEFKTFFLVLEQRLFLFQVGMTIYSGEYASPSPFCYCHLAGGAAAAAVFGWTVLAASTSNTPLKAKND